MEMRTVYRYENKNGHGPYATSEIWAMSDAHQEAGHPGWFMCMGKSIKEMPLAKVEASQYLASCESREALDAWFDGWQDTLARFGYHVVEYTVPAENVVDGASGLQCAFLPVSA